MSINCTPYETRAIGYCSRFIVPLNETTIWDHTLNIANTAHPNYNVVANAYRDVATGRVMLKIPNFQRGIQWDFDTLLDCLRSNSPIVGTIVAGKMLNDPERDWLLDGLQRFASFIALINISSDLLFKPPTPELQNPWNVHETLLEKVTTLQGVVRSDIGLLSIVKYNHLALRFHARAIIKDSYSEFYDNVKEDIDSRLSVEHPNYNLENSKEFLDGLINFFAKPIHILTYSFFRDYDQLVAAFIGINTVRVELSPADVCRSMLVENFNRIGANQAQCSDMENLFNSTLLQKNGRARPRFSPLIKVLEDDWINTKGKKLLSKLFSPTGNYNDAEREFIGLCGWIEYYLSMDSPYIDLLKDTGDNPFIATMMFYYSNNKASIEINEMPLIPSNELNKIVISYMRKLLDGGVGDTLSITKQVATGVINDIDVFIERVNPGRSGSIRKRPDLTWLETSVGNIKSLDSAKIVFKACLLPEVRRAANYGDPFDKMIFKNGQNNWTLDHLIPANAFDNGSIPSAGDSYKDSMRNLAPLIGSDNSSFRRRDLSLKFTDPECYPTYINPTDSRKKLGSSGHPYIEALYKKQATNVPPVYLDSRENLVIPCTDSDGNTRSLGEERIKLLADILKNKL